MLHVFCYPTPPSQYSILVEYTPTGVYSTKIIGGGSIKMYAPFRKYTYTSCILDQLCGTWANFGLKMQLTALIWPIFVNHYPSNFWAKFGAF